MRIRLPAAVAIIVVLAPWKHAIAQADVHAHAVARTTCQSGKQSDAVTQAAAALDRDPEELGPRVRLADALVDQGCYQEAVTVLEAGQRMHPRNGELAGKLRDVRSLVTEQTYIEGLTQAAESAKFQRNQLRCTRLADIAACDDALRFRPDDGQVLVAKGDALMLGNHGAEAAAVYGRAALLRPGDEAVKSKLTAAEALMASAPPPPPPATEATVQPAVAVADTATRSKAPKRTRPTAAPAAVASTATGTGQPPVATVASLEPQAMRTYSNDAPPGRTN